MRGVCVEKYQIGDRVECCVEDFAFNPGIHIGDAGTVCDLRYGSGNSIGVRWDRELPSGHTCTGTCRDSHGWYSLSQDIRLQTPDDQSGEPTDDFDVDGAEIDKYLSSLSIE